MTMKPPLALSIALFAIAGLAQAAEDKPQPAKQAAADPARMAQPEFKGIDLYCQYDKTIKQWRFGIMGGTNRQKSAQEVRDSLKIVGIKALKQFLAGLAKGEHVSLIPARWPGMAQGVQLDLPDQETLQDLLKFCVEREIHLSGDDALFAQANAAIDGITPSETRLELALEQSPLDAEGLKKMVTKCPNLEVLKLELCLGNADLAALGQLKHLKTLILAQNYELGAQSFDFLTNLQRLESLDLCYCMKLTDAACAHIGKCGSLRKLNLGTCERLTDKGIASLAALKNLQELSLDHCPLLTDAALTTLSGFADLRSLDLRWCKGMTDAKVSETAARLWPQCKLVLPSGKERNPK